MEEHDRPSTVRIVCSIVPWRYWTPVARIWAVLAAAGGLALFVYVYLAMEQPEWGMLLVIPTVAISLAGGVIYAAIGGLLITLFPTMVSLAFAPELQSPWYIIVVAGVIFTALAMLLGFVMALVISHRRALDEIRTLQGILPICAHCKRIRDNEGYWSTVEDYISSHSEVVFSHGLCEECLNEHYPEQAKAILKKRREGE